MLEIFLLIFLTRKIGSICEQKGRTSSIGFKIMLVAFWFLGEIFGAVFGAIISRGAGVAVYGLALLGAAIGAGVTFIIVMNLPQGEYVPPVNSFGSGYT